MAAPREETADDHLAARVIVLANRDDLESVELARYYAQRRGIPEQNIVALPMPLGETVDWHVFVAHIFDPLQTWLRERGWIDAIAMDLHDPAGRRKLAVSGHRVAFLTVCRGVPLKIRDTAGLPADGPARAPAQFGTHRASVDSELALLAQSGTRRDGFVANPLFARDAPSALELGRVVRVSRLDGPTAAAARQLIDGALTAERDGLIGRAYVDLGGPHPLGERWLNSAVGLLEQAGFEVRTQRERRTMRATDPADAAALYLGWYDSHVSGPFALADYRFPPGAIALHIHSFSAASLRDANGGGWCGPLVARGVAATFGNVHEPYLEYTHQPHLLMRALLRGATLGEAAYYAVAALSWQAIVVGDPLYRPFRVSFDEQWSRWRELPPEQASYVLLRRMEQLERAGDSAAARAVGEDGMRQAPSLALALALANRSQGAGDASAVRRPLALIRERRPVPVAEWALIAEAARLLRHAEAPALALEAWQALLFQPLPPDLRLAWLREARPVAAEVADAELGARWDRELAGETAAGR